MPRNIHQLRTLFVNFHLIKWDHDLVLIDGGFLAGIRRLKRQIQMNEIHPANIGGLRSKVLIINMYFLCPAKCGDFAVIFQFLELSYIK